MPAVARVVVGLLAAALLVACGAIAVAPSREAPGTDGGAASTPAPSRSATRSRPSRPSPTPTFAASPSASPIPSPPPSPTAPPGVPLGLAPTGPTQSAAVTRVIDGDTIEVSLGGVTYRLRYIGIDTPETVHPSQPTEWLGREASAANAELVAGETVVLEKDVSETDRYGRLLRYVWLQEDGGWLLVNLELLRRGLAVVTTYPPDVKYVDSLYLPAQRQAQAAGMGVWGTPPATPTAAPPGTACDPSYPGVCIPPPPPDLDCGDISERRFEVVPPDPHRFDGDGDGMGCES